MNDPSGRDGDDVFCFSPAQSTSVKVGGCLGSDADFDGVPYQNTWPGTFSNASQDALVHPSPIRFTSPLFNGTHNYAQAAFETDLPRIEFATSPPCQYLYTGDRGARTANGEGAKAFGADWYVMNASGGKIDTS